MITPTAEPINGALIAERAYHELRDRIVSLASRPAPCCARTR